MSRARSLLTQSSSHPPAATPSTKTIGGRGGYECGDEDGARKNNASNCCQFKTSTSSVSTTPIESPSSHGGAADSTDAEDRDLPAAATTVAACNGAPTVPEDDDFEEEEGVSGGREGVDAAGIMSTPERPTAMGIPPASPAEGGGGADANPLSPDTPRFAEFLDFIGQPSSTERSEEELRGEEEVQAAPDDFPDALSQVVSDFRR